jgi:DNA-binding response OmpR family regulator
MENSITVRDGRIQIGTLEINLTPKEALILLAVVKAGKTGVSKVVLYDLIWSSSGRASKSLNVHIYNLRRKIRVAGADILYLRSDRFVFVYEGLREQAEESPVSAEVSEIPVSS